MSNRTLKATGHLVYFHCLAILRQGNWTRVKPLRMCRVTFLGGFIPKAVFFQPC